MEDVSRSTELGIVGFVEVLEGARPWSQTA